VKVECVASVLEKHADSIFWVEDLKTLGTGESISCESGRIFAENTSCLGCYAVSLDEQFATV
jgi:hypothetical protein